MKKTLMFLLLCGMLLLSACGGEAAPSPSPSETIAALSPSPSVSPEASEQPTAGAAVTVTSITANEEFQTEGSAGTITSTLSISLPEISSEEYPEAAKELNRYFAEGMEELKLEFQDQVERFAPESATGFYLEVGYVVEYNQNGLLNLRMTREEYSGGAHGSTMIKCQLFDLASRGEIQLFQLFDVEPEEGFARLSECIIAQMDAMGEDMFYENAEEQVYGALASSNFAIRPEGLVVFYSEYDLAPHAAGTFEFVIPYAEISDILLEEFLSVIQK